MTKRELQNRYPDYEIFCQWRKVPDNLKTRAWFKERGVVIKGKRQVKAIKCNIGWRPDRKYFLFDIEDFIEQLKVTKKFEVKAFYKVNDTLKSDILFISTDKSEAEETLKKSYRKLYLGCMAVYELREYEIFEEKNNN